MWNIKKREMKKKKPIHVHELSTPFEKYKKKKSLIKYMYILLLISQKKSVSVM